MGRAASAVRPKSTGFGEEMWGAGYPARSRPSGRLDPLEGGSAGWKGCPAFGRTAGGRADRRSGPIPAEFKLQGGLDKKLVAVYEQHR